MDLYLNKVNSGISFPFPELPAYETPRLWLRELRPESLRFLLKKADQSAARKFLNIRTDKEWEQEQKKIKKGYTTWMQSFCIFLIFDKITGELIGRCGFHTWIIMHRRAEIGYGINADKWQRMGFMSEAMKFVIGYGFAKLNLNRIEACIAPTNEPSIKLAKKFEFVEEGLMRHHYLRNDITEDSLLFSLIRPELTK